MNRIWEILKNLRRRLETEDRDFHYDALLEAEEELRQLFPQPLDDEGLKKKIYHEVNVHYPMASQASKNYTTGQILALLQPKGLKELRDKIIELNEKLDDREADLLEAKRQEQERTLGIVVKELEYRKLIVHTHPLHGVDVCPMCLFVRTIRRALKGGDAISR